MNLDKLIEAFLLEAAALTKGSQRVMNDKKLVAALAATVRDDAAINPEAFPPGSKNNFKKATDDAVAQWFLENIDQIEREGYEGTVYSRDGVNSEWIVRRYIAGSHTWEDLTGVMNMNLRDWYLLKNRNMLDANHKDLSKFKSVRDVGFYMTTHYKDELEKVRDAAKNAARNKMAKNFKLVDNDDYRIYTAINRAAGCALGLGTQWCTANSNYSGHFHSYSGRAMLFQLFPYVTKKNAETGEEEIGLSDTAKYQFDASGPTFMDITDTPVPAAKVRETFPYIYTDLATALRKNKSKMEKSFEEWANDPTLQHEDFKIKNYEIDEEIKKLHKFVDRGYFTDEVRPSDKAEADAQAGEQPQIGAEPAQEQPPQEPQMETLKDLAKAMLEDKKLGQIVQKYVPIGDTEQGQDSPMTFGDDNLDEEEFDECGAGGIEQAKQALLATLSARSGKVDENDEYSHDDGSTFNSGSRIVHNANKIPTKQMSKARNDRGDEFSIGKDVSFKYGSIYPVGKIVEILGTENKFSSNKYLLKVELKGNIYTVDIDDASPINSMKEDMPAPEADAGDIGAQAATGGTLGAGGAGGAGGGQYPPGTAPTMPESVQEEITMEIDKDVAAMMSSLKKYDKLTESVLGMTTVTMARAVVEKDEGKHNNGKTTGFKAVAKNAAKEYGSKEAGERVAGAVKAKMAKAGKLEEAEVDEDAVDDFKAKGGKVKELPYKADKEEKGKSMGSKHYGKGGQGSKGEVSGLKARVAAKESIAETADQDVLDWMSRFSKLGNMKGYGR